MGKCNRIINESRPIVDARLDNGARVNAVVEPVSLDGPALTIRRFPDVPITMETLIAWGSITREAAGFLRDLVKAGIPSWWGRYLSGQNDIFECAF